MIEWDLLRSLATPTRTHQNIYPSEEESIDWERFVSLAMAHRLGPTLVANAERFDGVPQSVKDKLRARTRAETRSSLHLTSELHAILDTLGEAGIEALPYKGPVLSAVAHDDVGVRQYADVDVLVPTADFDRACIILKREGYEPFQRLNALGEVAFEDETGATVDLHRAVLPRYFPRELAFADLWNRREYVDVGGREVPALDSADRFVVLAVHGTKHCWYRLAWVHDIATLVATDRVPWDGLRERATEHHCGRHVHLACWLAREVYGVTLPDAVADAADADPAVATLGREAIEGLRKREATPPTDGEQHRYQWRTLKRWPDRLVYATRVVTIPSEGDVRSVALPESLAPLYRVVRPARLVARGGRHGVRKLRSQV